MLRLAALLCVLIQAGAVASAAEVGDLYRAETIVTGTVEPERTRGFAEGLVQVVVKLTGDPRLAGDPRLRPLLASPHRFIERFEYEDRMKGIPVHDEQGTRERPHFLRMRFDRATIDRELERLGLAKWPSDRPVVAVWLGVKTAERPYVLHDSGPEGYGQRVVLTDEAQRLGLPVRLPDADGPAAGLTFDQINRGAVKHLAGASQDADAWLAGVLALTEHGYWDITWRFAWKDRSRAWTQREVTFDTAIEDGLQTATLILSGNLAP